MLLYMKTKSSADEQTRICTTEARNPISVGIAPKMPGGRGRGRGRGGRGRGRGRSRGDGQRNGSQQSQDAQKPASMELRLLANEAFLAKANSAGMRRGSMDLPRMQQRMLWRSNHAFIQCAMIVMFGEATRATA